MPRERATKINKGVTEEAASALTVLVMAVNIWMIDEKVVKRVKLCYIIQLTVDLIVPLQKEGIRQALAAL